MKMNNYKKQYSVNKSISSVWEEMHNLTGYTDYKVSNIHKKDKDTWCFDFYFAKNKFSKVIANSITGKAYSKVDNLTSVEIKYGSTASTFYVFVPFLVISIIDSFIRENPINLTTRVLLMICILAGYTYVFYRDSKLNLYEFLKKLKLEENTD